MRTIIFSLLACLFVMLSGCGSQEEVIPTSSIESKGKGTILIKVVSPDRGGRLGKIVAIDRITAFVFNSDDEITQDLTREGDRAKATISVDPGNWAVTINSYEGDLIVKTGSDSDVDVKAGQTTTAEIAPVSFIPTLSIEGESTGIYTVTWNKIFSAHSYTLQEDDNSAFSTPEILYIESASDTAKSFTGKAAGTSYYYRVYATNRYGNSKWSGWAAVNISADGTIEIDIPWDVWDEETDGSGSTVPQFTSNHPDLEVYGKVNLSKSYSGTKVTGEFINRGTSTIFVASITVTLLDHNGTSLGYDMTYIAADVAPGGIRPFTVDVYDVAPEQVAGGRVAFDTL